MRGARARQSAAALRAYRHAPPHPAPAKLGFASLSLRNPRMFGHRLRIGSEATGPSGDVELNEEA